MAQGNNDIFEVGELVNISKTKRPSGRCCHGRKVRKIHPREERVRVTKCRRRRSGE